MKRENKIKLFSTIFVVLVVLTLIFNRVLLRAKNFLDIKFLPLQTDIYSFTDKVKNNFSALYSYSEIIKENERLKKENMELRLLNNSNEQILKENERLTELLQMKETNKRIKNLKFARVVFKDIYNLNRKFYIDLGIENGIEKNMLVIYKENLVGRIVETFSNYSVVEMSTNNNARISARTSSGLLGVTQGNDENDRCMYFQPSTFEETLEVGEEIFTSGVSSIYPAGLKIGKITDIDRKENNIFKSIRIEPEFESKDLREVMVYKYENGLEKKGN